MQIQQIIEAAVNWAVTKGLQILIILIVMVVAVKIINKITAKIFEKLNKNETDIEVTKRKDTLYAIVKSFSNVVIYAITIMMILDKLSVNIGPVLAAAGVLGLAIGFGAQKVVEDVLSGFFILMEDQIRVGDVVIVGDKGGLVEKVNLRMIILRDLAGNVHYIRNGSIGVVTNMTKEYSRYVFNIGVAYREDVDEVIEVIKQIDDEMRKDPLFKNDILEPIEILGLDQFADSAVIIKARTKTKPIKQWYVGREFNKRLKKKFDEQGIEIPFPHRTLYMGQDKKGNSPVLNISTDNKK